MLTTVLLIDDQHRDYETQLKTFMERGLTLHRADSPSETLALLSKGIEYDLVVLDWLLDGESSALSCVILKHLMGHRAVPVLIWSETPPKLEDVQEKCPWFPPSLLMTVSKQDVDATKLAAEAAKFYEGRPIGKLAMPLRAAVTRAAEQTLWELAKASDANMLASIKHVAGGQADVVHANEAIHQLLLRHMLDTDAWRNMLKDVLGNEAIVKPTGEKADYGRLMHLQRYFHRHDVDVIRSGDVVRVSCKETGLERYALILTPACDVAQKNTAYIRLALLHAESAIPKYRDSKDHRSNMRKGSKQDRQWLPYCVEEKNSLVHLVSNFHEILVVQFTVPGHEWDPAPTHLHYADKFSLVGQPTAMCRLDYVISVDEPYRSSILNRFSSHASRLGTPDVDPEVT